MQERVQGPGLANWLKQAGSGQKINWLSQARPNWFIQSSTFQTLNFA